MEESEMWYIYWFLIVALIIGIIWAARKYQDIADYAGMVVGQLLSNNNYRAIALFIIAIVMTGSAILAGFGKPLMNDSLKVVHEQSNSAVKAHWFDVLIWGEDAAKKMAHDAYSEPEYLQKGYSSWLHWWILVFLWPFTLLYGLFATREEVAEAWSDAITALRSRQAQITSGEAGTSAQTTTTQVQVSGGSNFWQEFNIEVIIEFLKYYVGKIARIR